MDFDSLVDRAVSLYDVTTDRAADVANERLGRMVSESKSLRKVMTLATTTSGTASYPLDPSVVQLYKAKATYSGGQVNYEGVVSLDELWDVDAGLASAASTDAFFAIEADTDSDETTDNVRFYPTPGEDGVVISGLVAVMPDTLSYGSSSPLPIPIDAHEHLLAGVKAELSDETGNQAESQKFEQVFTAGIALLQGRVASRGTGSGRHRARMAGYDVPRQ